MKINFDCESLLFQYFIFHKLIVLFKNTLVQLKVRQQILFKLMIIRVGRGTTMLYCTIYTQGKRLHAQ